MKEYWRLALLGALLAGCGPNGPPLQVSPTGQFSAFDPRTGAFTQSALVPDRIRAPDTIGTLTAARAPSSSAAAWRSEVCPAATTAGARMAA